MRLWSLHPKFLDAQGLVACWREALLARAVLRNETRGYRNHPQLDRFRSAENPLATLEAYLWELWEEGTRRGYRFDEDKLGERLPVGCLAVHGRAVGVRVWSPESEAGEAQPCGIREATGR